MDGEKPTTSFQSELKGKNSQYLLLTRVIKTSHSNTEPYFTQLIHGIGIFVLSK